MRIVSTLSGTDNLRVPYIFIQPHSFRRQTIREKIIGIVMKNYRLRYA